MSKRIVGALVALVLGVSALALTLAPPAQAAIAQTWVCDGAGNLFVTKIGGTTEHVQFTGTARCGLGDEHGPYLATFSGVGSMSGPACNGGLPLATGFKMRVTMDAVSVINSRVHHIETMEWLLKVTTFPRITPVAVMQNAAGTDAGSVIKGAGHLASAKTACQGDENSSGVLFDAAWLDRL